MKGIRLFTAILFFLTAISFGPKLLAQAQITATAGVNPMKIVGYFPRYGINSGFFVKNLVTNGSAKVLTHIDYAFTNVVNNRCVSFDTSADYQLPVAAAHAVNGVADTHGGFAGNFHQLQELKKLYPNLKVIMSIGGGSSDPAAFRSAALPQNRQAFVKSCVTMYIQGYFGSGLHQPGIFDGFDLDWEFPASTADRTNFTGLLAEFRHQLDAVKTGLTLSIAGPNGRWAYQYIDVNTVQKYLTYVNLMTYDYDGPWKDNTGLVAPLYRSLKDPEPNNNASATVEGYMEAGLEPEKIIFGVPFYGYEWTNVPNLDNGLFEPGDPHGQGAAYNSIVNIESKFHLHRDSITEAPYLYDGTNYWTYDDVTSIKFKMAYVRSHNLGGVMAWNLSQDLSNATLLNAVVSGLKPAN
jgi:chitinase